MYLFNLPKETNEQLYAVVKAVLCAHANIKVNCASLTDSLHINEYDCSDCGLQADDTFGDWDKLWRVHNQELIELLIEEYV